LAPLLVMIRQVFSLVMSLNNALMVIFLQPKIITPLEILHHSESIKLALLAILLTRTFPAAFRVFYKRESMKSNTFQSARSPDSALQD